MDELTVGVAVELPEPYASELRDHRASFGDAEAFAIPTHVTLVPPATIESDVLPKVEQHLAEVAARHQPFDVRLRGTGTFRPVSPVVFVAVALGISRFGELARDVRAGPLAVELEFPYHPHVTVAHDLDAEALDLAYDSLAAYECAFTVDRFVLYAHDADTGWHEHQALVLGAPA
jgi:2'-5' RNA ligase